MAVNSASLVVGNATVTITRPTSGGGTGIATDCGGLLAGDGVTITPTFTTYSPDIEQEQNASRIWYQNKKYQLQFTMCEPTLENIKNAWDCINAITAGPPRLMSFGSASSAESIPTACVILVTMFTPNPTSGSPSRSITFFKAYLDSPGAMKITKSAISTLPQTWTCAFDTTAAKVGSFSDAMS